MYIIFKTKYVFTNFLIPNNQVLFEIDLRICFFQSTEESVIEDVQNVLFPYLERCEKLSDNATLKESLFKEYVVNVGKEDLTLPIMVSLFSESSFILIYLFQ